VKFLIDNQLPSALAAYLHDKGFETEHVLDIGLADASDVALCKYATENKCVIVSKDEDFLYLANRPKADFQFLWIRLGNCRTAVLLENFERVWQKVETSLAEGERVVEIR
jgi:predicted nuclease of predicted toxin-antitoxin system